MNAVIIGGDNLDVIQTKLKTKGFDNIQHISGRKGSERKMDMILKSKNIDVVIILVDFINHSAVYTTKKMIKGIDVKTIFSKRSWIHLESQINNFVAAKSIQS